MLNNAELVGSALICGRLCPLAYFFWIILAVITPFGFLPYSRFDYVIVDLAETIYHVKELAIGRVPYRDIFSHHFLGYLLPFYAVELLTPITPVLIKVLNVIFHFLHAIILANLVRCIAGSKYALLAGFVTVSLGWLPGIQGATFNNQSYITPLLSLVLLLLVASCRNRSARYFYLAGLLGGLLMTFDQRLVLFLPLLLIPMVTVKELRSLKKLGLMAFLVLLFPVVCLAWLWHQAALLDFYQQTFIYPLYYRNLGLANMHHLIVSHLLYFAFVQEPAAFIFMSSGFVLLIRYEERNYVRLLCAWTFCACLLYVAIGGRFFANYLLIFSPLLILSVTLLPYYAGNLSGRIARVLFWGVFAICVWSMSWPFLRHLCGLPYFIAGDETIVAQAGHYIKRGTTAQANVLVWGYGPKVYLMAERFSGFRDMGLISIGGANYGSAKPEKQGIVPGMLREFKQYLNDSPPELVLYYQVTKLAGPYRMGLGPLQKNMDFRNLAHLAYFRDFLQSHYDLVRTFTGNYDRAEVYQLRMRSRRSITLANQKPCLPTPRC